jgi:hypothetical protein
VLDLKAGARAKFIFAKADIILFEDSENGQRLS